MGNYRNETDIVMECENCWKFYGMKSYWTWTRDNKEKNWITSKSRHRTENKSVLEKKTCQGSHWNNKKKLIIIIKNKAQRGKTAVVNR